MDTLIYIRIYICVFEPSIYFLLVFENCIFLCQNVRLLERQPAGMELQKQNQTFENQYIVLIFLQRLTLVG